MHQRKITSGSSLKNIICIISLMTVSLFSQTIGFLPFENNSSFKDIWKLENDIPGYLADTLARGYNVNAAFISDLPESYFKQGKSFNKFDFEDWQGILPYPCDVLVYGYVDKFDLTRYNVAEPTLAGYEYYSFTAELRIIILNFKHKTVSQQLDIKTGISRNTVGLNLFGRTSDDQKKFFGLDKLIFGSERFMESIVGEGMRDVYRQFDEHYAREILKISPELNTEKTPSLSGTILTYDSSSGDCFVNMITDGLRPNDALFVYSPADSLFDISSGEFLGVSEGRIGELKVIEVRNAKLVYAVVVSGSEKIRTGLSVKYFRK